MKKLILSSILLLTVLSGIGLFSSAVLAVEDGPECEYRSMGTIGFWKNHEELYIPLLPVFLGGEEITNQGEADEVFDNAESDEMKDMLRAQLLATKFNILYHGIGDFVFEGKTIAEHVSDADLLLQDPEAGRDDLELLKNIFNSFNNLKEILICPSVLGCTDPEALNYDPEATEDDGTCEYPPIEVLGCTDPEALNYNPEANIDDGSCEYENVCSPDSFNWGELDRVDIGNLLSESTHNLEGWSEANIPGNYGGCQQGVVCDYRQVIEPLCTENRRSAYLTIDTGDDVASKIIIRHLDGISLLDSFDVYVNNNLVGSFDDDTLIVSEVWRETEFNVQQYGFYGPIQLEIRATDSIWNQCSTYGQVSIDWISAQGCGYSEPEIPGCMDPEALNYDPEATVDDDSCEYEIPGCTDPAAINFNPEATIDDGSCEYEPPFIPGCTDPEASNYNPEANIDDGSCEYPELFSISGMKFNDENNNSVNDEEPGLIGWTIELYASEQLISSTVTDTYGNYSFLNLEAGEYRVCELPQVGGWIQTHPTENNGCHMVNLFEIDAIEVDFGNYYEGFPVFGCTDPAALNYDSLADIDDGSCEYPPVEIPGCTDPVATNYNPLATIDDGSCEYEPPVIPGCTDPVALNYEPAANLDDGSCEYPELFSISGMKFNDQNDNGTNDSEPGLMDWTIELYLSDQLINSTITDTYGNYSFLSLDPGTYTVCELPQVGGWVQTYPTANNGCHVVELIDENLSEYDFGNHYANFQIPGCMDPEALNYNSGATYDDGTCIYEIPGCTDPNANNYNPQATVNDGSCSYGGSVRPRFSIAKTVAEEFVNAGDTANYTIIVEALGSGVARNTVLKDILPQGFSYEDEQEDGEWDLGDMARGDKETVTFAVVVSKDAEAGEYVNTAEVQASNSSKYTDTAELEVRTIPVKGEEFFPELEIDKSVDRTTAEAGSYVLYTIKIKNVGDAPGVNLVVTDALPQGFIAEDGKTELVWNIPLLKEGDTWETSFSVYIQSDVQDGRYENVVVASGENHPEEVEDIALVVLGSLPHTGTTIPEILRDWIGVEDSISSAPMEDYLAIPSIGVQIPIVQGVSEAALELGAWLLPQTTTPDSFGNTALAAHRYKYRPPHKETFYLLDEVSQGDNLLVYWKGDKYTYSVSSISVVEPTDTSVLLDTGTPTLTLITCHPLFSDTYRLIVQGELVI